MRRLVLVTDRDEAQALREMGLLYFDYGVGEWEVDYGIAPQDLPDSAWFRWVRENSYGYYTTDEETTK